MQDATRLTRPQQLLIAATTLHDPFTLPALVMAVWRAHPAAWGLRGYESESADNNLVKTYLVRKRVLMRNELIQLVGKGKFQLTDKGRQEADEAKRNGRKFMGPHFSRPAYIQNHDATRLARMLRSVAYHRWASVSAREFIGRPEAFDFWGLRPGACPSEIRKRHKSTANTFNRVTVDVTCKGQVITRRDVLRLAECHRWLVELLERKPAKAFQRVG